MCVRVCVYRIERKLRIKAVKLGLVAAGFAMYTYEDRRDNCKEFILQRNGWVIDWKFEIGMGGWLWEMNE